MNYLVTIVYALKKMLDGFSGSGIIGTEHNENRGSKTMKNKIEFNIESLNNMKREQAILYQDTFSETLSEASRSVILKEIDAIQSDLDMLAEKTAQLIAEYFKAPNA